MKAEIVYKNTIDNDAMIEWSDKGESGQISIMYDEKGEYIVNAEYIDIFKLLEILSKTTSSDIEEKYTLIDAELTKAKQKHSDYPDDMFRQVAIINEESGEATKAVLHYHYENGSIEDIKKELIQTAAMCMRMLENLTDKFREDINIDYSREDGK